MSFFARERESRTSPFIQVLLILAFSWITAASAQVFDQTVLHNFTNSPDGKDPYSGIILGRDGLLYGTAENGGAYYYGILFQINRNGTGYNILHQFNNFTGTDPGPILQGIDGSIYGVASQSGSNNVGTIFKISTNVDNYVQIHAFDTTDGEYPSSPLFQGSDGVLYGCADDGGISNCGTLFRLNPDGSDFQVLHQFTNTPDGTIPAVVILARDGNLYGLTAQGGSASVGTIFKTSTNGGNYSILYSFTNTPDGAYPGANLIQGTDGALYGTTAQGGIGGYFSGTAFKISTNGMGYQTLHEFPTVNYDGYDPESLMQGADGLIYGETWAGGKYGNGMLFRMDTNGNNYTVLYSFVGMPGTGVNPAAPLVDGGDGAFYSTTANGGSGPDEPFADGTIYRVAVPLALSLHVSPGLNQTNIAVLSWPAWANLYSLQTSPSLASGAAWTTVNGATNIGSMLYLTNHNNTGSAFYRLQAAQ